MAKETTTDKKKSKKKAGESILGKATGKWGPTYYAQLMLDWLKHGAQEVTVVMDDGQVITIRNPQFKIAYGPDSPITLDVSQPPEDKL